MRAVSSLFWKEKALKLKHESSGRSYTLYTHTHTHTIICSIFLSETDECSVFPPAVHSCASHFFFHCFLGGENVTLPSSRSRSQIHRCKQTQMRTKRNLMCHPTIPAHPPPLVSANHTIRELMTHLSTGLADGCARVCVCVSARRAPEHM